MLKCHGRLNILAGQSKQFKDYVDVLDDNNRKKVLRLWKGGKQGENICKVLTLRNKGGNLSAFIIY